MTPADSHDARVARSAVAGRTDDSHAAGHAIECLDIAPRTETIAASDCTDQSGPSPLLDSTHNVCPYPITNAVPIERPSLLLSIPDRPVRASPRLPQPHNTHAVPMTDRTNFQRSVQPIARARLLSGPSGAEPVPAATSMKRARRDSPPCSPQQNTVAFPSSEGSFAMPKPAGKRARVAIALKPLTSIGEENEAAEETLGDNCAASRARLNSISFITTTRTSSRRKSRRQRLYATQFPARSFVPRLESITEITEHETLPHLACETAHSTAVMLSHHDVTNPVKTAIKILTSTTEGGAGRRRSLTLIEPLRGAWRRLRRADEEH